MTNKKHLYLPFILTLKVQGLDICTVIQLKIICL